MADTFESIDEKSVVVNWDNDYSGKVNVDADFDDFDNVKDNWEDEEEEEVKIEEKPKTTVVKNKEEKKPPVEVKDMTEEEKKQAQIDADLLHAKELFGLEKSLDEMNIDNKDSLKDYVSRFNFRVSTLSKSANYLEFIEELFKATCQNLTGDQVRKLSNAVKAISDQKLNEEKLAKAKDTKKPKSKGKIKLEANRIKGDYDSFLKDSTSGAVEEDDDDFM